MAARSIYPGELHLTGINGSESYSVNGTEMQEDEEDYDEQFSDSAQEYYKISEIVNGHEAGQAQSIQRRNRDYSLQAFLNDISIIAANLRQAGGISTSTGRPLSRSSEGFEQQENPAGVAIAGGALAFDILRAGISTLKQGDLTVTMPTGEIGVIPSNVPPGVRLNTRTILNKVIFSYRDTNPISGIEQVNIQLTCTVQYNGPQVTASFGFTPDGTRSRLMRDTTINIRNPLSLQTMRAPENWVRAGITEYPVVLVPIEVRVNRPWPLSNANFSFNLVLSGMYGLGRTANGRYKENEIRRDN